MDITDTIQDLGLAEEIKNGLSSSQQKPPNWKNLQPNTDAKKSELEAMGGMAVIGTKLGKFVMVEWAKGSGRDLSQARRRSSATGKSGTPNPPTEAGVNANWEDFKADPAFEVLAKYLALADELATAEPGIKQFEELRPLGKGAFGAVYLTFKKDTGYALATKKILKGTAKKNHMLKDVLIEREVLSKVKSPFCVSLHYAYQDDNTVSLTLTLCPGGDLSFLMQSRYSDAKKKEDRKFSPLPASVVKFYVASMALGLEAIHKAGYVYRDLKPQNVLLDIDGQVRISDMGLTHDISKGSIKQCSGTRGYWSPETIKKESYTTQPDWWSLGVTAYVLTSDKMPFKGKTDEEKDAATVSGAIEYSHGEPADIQGLISALCTIDVNARLGCTSGVKDLMQHPYFSGFDWRKLEAGNMEADIKPNPNDINAPSKNEIPPFTKPKDVEWNADDQAKFADWNYMDKDLWMDEAMFRIQKKKEIKGMTGGGGGGGGCCTIA